MKNKKIISVIMLVITLLTLFIPLFSVNTFAALEPANDYSIDFRLVGSLSYGSSVRVLGANGVLAELGTISTNFRVYYANNSPLYDSELDAYFYRVEVTTNGYIPSAAIYNANASFNSRVEFDNGSDTPYIRNGSRIDIEVSYPSTPGDDFIKYSQNFYIYTYTTDVAYNDGYTNGYRAGMAAGEREGYKNGKEDGYDEGYEAGVIATSSEVFGKNLLGQTLNAPMQALNSFVLIELGEVDITLGYVIGAIIGLSLLLAFLKMFAGG